MRKNDEGGRWNHTEKCKQRIWGQFKEAIEGIFEGEQV